MSQPLNVNQVINRILLVCLFIFCILPGMFFSFVGLQSPWVSFRVARANLSLYSGHMEKFVNSATGYRAEHIGGELIHAALLSASDWPATWVTIVPFGSLLVAFLYYAVGKNVSSHRWTAPLLTIYACWHYPMLVSQFGAETYAWTNVLFLTYLLLFYFWLQERRAILSLLLMVVFTATFLHYHSTPIWMISCTTCAVVLMRLRSSKITDFYKVSTALPLFCFVLYFSFDTVVYGNALERLKNEVVLEELGTSFINRIIAPLFYRAPETLSPFTVAPLSPRLATWSTLIVLLTASVPVGIWCVYTLYNLVRSKDWTTFLEDHNNIFIVSIIGAALTHTAMYSAYGSFSTRLIPLTFPLILPLIVRIFGKYQNFVEAFLFIILSIASVSGFVSYASPIVKNHGVTEAGVVAQLLESESKVLADATTYGTLLLESTQLEKVLNFAWVDSDNYTEVTGGQQLDSAKFDYLVTDNSNRAIISTGWVFYEPWLRNISSISRNPALNKIYESNKVTIFQPVGSEIPSSVIDPGLEVKYMHSFVYYAARLLLTIFVIGFFPGTVALYILNDGELLKYSDFATFMGLSVGLSIVCTTYVGYISNFTPLGLKWLIPVCLALPTAVIAIYTYSAQSISTLRAQSAWIVKGGAVLIILWMWVLLSVSVADIREELNATHFEFFVTRYDASDSFAVNLVNRQDIQKDFTIVLESDGVELETIGPLTLAPNTLWSENWKIPSDNKIPLSIELKTDGKVQSSLHVNP